MGAEAAEGGKTSAAVAAPAAGAATPSTTASASNSSAAKTSKDSKDASKAPKASAKDSKESKEKDAKEKDRRSEPASKRQDKSAPAKDDKKEKEKGKEKEKEKPKTVEVVKSDKTKSTAVAVAPRAVVKEPPRTVLSDEQLTQLAQAKFEAQEDKLRDVARLTMSLVRDLPKLSEADRVKRVTDAQKALQKYEMLNIRGWEYQERRRKLEIARLGEEAERCRQAADEEGERTVELQQDLERAKKRQKRYEAHEVAATEVNRMSTRADSEAKIAAAKEDLARIRRQQAEHEALQEERTQRAQLLRHAVAELEQDLQREREAASKVLGGSLAPTDAAAATTVVS